MERREILYAPWRSSYIKSVSKGGDSGCIFCEAPKHSDEEALILHRGRHAYIIMNLYPYNSGHVMVVPYRHVASLEDLTAEEELEVMELVKLSLRAIRRALSPHGFNVGVNIGRAAGAGVEDHVHVHVVPRWNGDSNFMPVLAGVRVISQDIKETYQEIRRAIKEILGGEEEGAARRKGS